MGHIEKDQKLNALAKRQKWLFNRKQACTVGVSPRTLADRLDRRVYMRFEPSVYGMAGHPITWKRRLKAAELGTPDSAVGGLAAAALLELQDFRPGRAELVAPPCTSSRGKLATIHREVGFLTTEVDGIRVTTIAQTLFDIALRVSGWRLERAMDDAIVSGRLSVAELEERLAFYEGTRRNGIRRMRALIGERSADGWVPPESELEARLDLVLERLPSRPRILRQAALPWRTTVAGRVDRFLPDFGIIVEGDSRRWHTRVADFDRDNWRNNQATAHGLAVLRFTWLHLNEWPDDVVDLTEQTIATRRRAA